MSEQQKAISSRETDDEIDLIEFLKVIWKGRWLIMLMMAIFAITSVLYVLSLPNIYKSNVLLAPAIDQRGGNLSQLGGLAALAGVSLGRGGGIDKTIFALEVMKSREFIGEFIERHNILPILMASKRWDINSNKIIYDPKLYDSMNHTWLREKKGLRSSEPSLQEAHKKFLSILSVEQNKSTGMIVVGIEHISPHIAKEWLELLISDINSEIRKLDIEEASQSVQYLSKQIEETKLSSVRASLASLIEEQMNTLMLANVRAEYMFRTVDRPVVSEEKYKPARALICIVVTLLGGFVGVLIVILRGVYARIRFN